MFNIESLQTIQVLENLMNAKMTARAPTNEFSIVSFIQNISLFVIIKL